MVARDQFTANRQALIPCRLSPVRIERVFASGPISIRRIPMNSQESTSIERKPYAEPQLIEYGNLES